MVVRGLSLRRQILCLALGLAAALLCLLLFTYYHLERNKVTEQYVRHWLVDSGRFSAASEILHTRDSRAARTLLNQVMTVPDVEYTALIQPSGEHFAEAGFSPTNPTALELVAVRSNLDAEQQSYFCFNGRFYFLQRLQAQHTHQGSLLSVSSMHLPLAQLRHRMWGILVFALAALGVFALFFDQWLRRRCAPLEQLLVKLSGRTLTAPVLCAAEVAQVEQTLMCSDTIARERELQLQEQLRAATEKAREQAKFVAIVSHEIRTPMNGVLGMIELLQSTALSEEQCKFVEAVSRSGKSLLQVVDDVLDYTKLEGGKLVLEQVDFDLCEQIERVFEMLGQQGRKKSLQLDYHLDPGFSGWLHGDPLRMRQVLMNLVDNAIKFTHIGKVSIAVELIDQDTPKLRVSVSDTGPGIAQEAQASIFEFFSQSAGNSKHSAAGSGLGLAICRQLVELMGGEIGVESALGAGSRFWFEITLLKPEKAIQAQPVSLSNLKVLLIHSSQDERLMDDLAQWELECELVADVQVLAALQPLESWDCVLAVVEDELGLAQQLTALAQLRFASDRLILLNRLSPLPAQLAVDKIQWSIVDYVNAQRGAQSLLHQLKRKIHASARQIVGEADYSAVRVLLVEDSPVNLQVTQGLLRRLGCRVHTACNGVEALQQWERKHWDLILMDIEMPVMDGVLATQNIRRRERERGTSRTPIIALTAHVMAGDRELYLTNDMDDFLAKPFSRDDLERVIVRWSTQVSSAVKISDRDIDTTVLDSLNGLKDSNGEPLLAPLIDSYLHLSTSIIEEMQLARQSEDVIQIRQLAKALKTSANHLGLQQVHWLSRKLESSSSGRHGSQLETDIVQLNRANRQACKALVSWRGR